jgi:hypothetical protein
MEVGLFFEELDALDGYTAEYDPSIPVHPADLPIEPEQQQGQEIQRNSAVDTAGIVIESDEDTMEPVRVLSVAIFYWNYWILTLVLAFGTGA